MTIYFQYQIASSVPGNRHASLLQYQSRYPHRSTGGCSPAGRHHPAMRFGRPPRGTRGQHGDGLEQRIPPDHATDVRQPRRRAAGRCTRNRPDWRRHVGCGQRGHRLHHLLFRLHRRIDGQRQRQCRGSHGGLYRPEQHLHRSGLDAVDYLALRRRHHRHLQRHPGHTRYQ